MYLMRKFLLLMKTLINLIKRCLEEIILVLAPLLPRWKLVNSTYVKVCGSSILNKGLFLWEEEVIKKFFPKPPARILVGACGAGRELLALGNQGYSLTAFEPLNVFAKCAQVSIPKENLLAFSISTYEDLVSGKLKEIESFAPYDAVILGWGSFTHILDQNIQKMLLEKVRKLCPAGPILLSWLKATYAGPKTKIFRRMLTRIGFKEALDRDQYSFGRGFCHTFTRDEIFDLASSTNNSIVFYEDEKPYPQGYPHAVLLPQSQKLSNFVQTESESLAPL